MPADNIDWTAALFPPTMKGYYKQRNGNMFRLITINTDVLIHESQKVLMLDDKGYFSHFYASGAFVKNVPTEFDIVAYVGQTVPICTINKCGWYYRRDGGLARVICLERVYIKATPDIRPILADHIEGMVYSHYPDGRCQVVGCDDCAADLVSKIPDEQVEIVLASKGAKYVKHDKF